jgi:hypothetical protein
MLTSETLVKNCLDNELPTSSAVLCDYFGIFNTSTIKKDIIFDVYCDIVINKNVTASELHTALKANKLNKLIKNKMLGSNTQCYKDFCTMNIVVGTNIDGSESE